MFSFFFFLFLLFRVEIFEHTFASESWMIRLLCVCTCAARMVEGCDNGAQCTGCVDYRAECYGSVMQAEGRRSERASERGWTWFYSLCRVSVSSVGGSSCAVLLISFLLLVKRPTGKIRTTTTTTNCFSVSNWHFNQNGCSLVTVVVIVQYIVHSSVLTFIVP